MTRIKTERTPIGLMGKAYSNRALFVSEDQLGLEGNGWEAVQASSMEEQHSISQLLGWQPSHRNHFLANSFCLEEVGGKKWLISSVLSGFSVFWNSIC